MPASITVKVYFEAWVYKERSSDYASFGLGLGGGYFEYDTPAPAPQGWSFKQHTFTMGEITTDFYFGAEVWNYPSNLYDVKIAFQGIPEPATMVMLGLMVPGIFVGMKKRRR